KLTLTSGIRWDRYAPVYEVENRSSFLDPYGANPGAGNRPGRLAFAGDSWGSASFGRRTPVETDNKGLSPRLGIAYSLNPNTVVRAAYGVFFVLNNWYQVAVTGFNAPVSFSSSLGGMQPAFRLRDGVPQNFARPPFIDSTFSNGQAAPTYF